jgi:hypothetical protein
LQSGFNERLQKSAYLTYSDTNQYNGVLLGSSRTTYYNSNDFLNKKIFNYSVSGIYPYEYGEFIDYLKKIKHQPTLEYIVLGVDFYGSQAQRKSKNKTVFTFRELEDKYTFIFKSLFNLKTLSHSLKNLKRWARNKTGNRSYTRENFVVVDRVPEKKVKSKTQHKIKTYYRGYTEYNENYTRILTKLKINNPESKFIIYTTPLAKPFLDHIFQNDQLFKYYVRWIRELTDIYGEIYFFTQYGDFAYKYTTYSKDGEHYYPAIGKYILNTVSGAEPSKTYENTYTVLNSSNIDHFIDQITKLRKDMSTLSSDELLR